MFLPSLSILVPLLLYLTHRIPALPASSADNDFVTSGIHKRSIPPWQFYYGVDSGTHQSNFNNLTSQGYRLISLSSYGSSSSALYAAVWVQRSGPSWSAIHNANATAYQAWFDEYSAQGYVSTIVSVTGPREEAVYSGVMEQISVTSWVQWCDMTLSDFNNNDQEARGARQILRSFREYGTSSDRRYCAVWHANPTYDKSSLFNSPMTASDYQAVFDSETTKPYWRPGYLSISEDQNYAAMFTDASIGTSWVARHDMTAADLQSAYEAWIAAGLYIIQLTGGGSGADTRYAAIFASQDIPSSRTWRTTGNAAVGFSNNAAAEAQSEAILQSFMQATGVRQVQLSVAKNGVPLLDKAYTWSEAERPTTQVSDTVLLASVSKAFLEAAVQSLYDNGKLTPATTVYPFLGYSASSGDPRRFDITVQQLLDHEGGYNTSQSGDPTYNMRNIAIAQSGGSRPASVKDVVDYVFQQPLDFTPGEGDEYSNYGYLLLSYVVEVATNTPYFTYLQNTFLIPEGLNVRPWLTDPATHVSDNVIQESQYTGLSARQPLYPYNVADIYGGDGEYKDSALGCASLASSAQSLAKFINTHAAWGNGGRAPGYARSGSTPGTSTWIESRWDNIDWALTVNTRDFPNGDNDFNGVVQNIDNWLNTNPTI
ncbi:hypothetical protein GYMLUDRAFT_202701 [Collybiopsis luxurians FD-317 M1]|uniref:Unplaced genomic scaffold GYMLUscaffold_38, whole genome shotgun sequence n=1 Tax=Collybiopsis luxurians FD-317 M1 TaxID=944289 RepID=A0A0D0CRI8_9AGAR|nr:hypothetical protein GYMLUDRAFT_202701 [Collybiopsis luxurians FD-317 M1]